MFLRDGHRQLCSRWQHPLNPFEEAACVRLKRRGREAGLAE